MDIGLKVRDFNKIEKSLNQLGIDKLPIQKLKELNIDIENYTKQEKVYLYKSTKKYPGMVDIMKMIISLNHINYID